MPVSTSAVTPADRVHLWTIVSDVARWPAHLPTFISVTPVTPEPGVPHAPATPTGVGSAFDVRQPGLPRARWVITHWDPGHAFVWVTRSAGATATAEHRLSSVEGGTRLDLTLAWSGPAAPLMRLLLARRAQHMIDLEATTLTRLANTGE